MEYLLFLLASLIIGLIVNSVTRPSERELFIKRNKGKYRDLKEQYLQVLERYQTNNVINDDINEEYIKIENNILYLLKKLYNIEYYWNKGFPTELETMIPISEIRYFSLEGGVSSQQLGGKTVIVLNDNHRTITVGSHHVYDLLLDYIPEKEYSNYIENKKEKGRKIK